MACCSRAPVAASGTDSGHQYCTGGAWVVTRGKGTGTQKHWQNEAWTTFAYGASKVRIWAPGYYHTADWVVFLSDSINLTETYAYCPP